jgi:hypothetical protein
MCHMVDKETYWKAAWAVGDEVKEMAVGGDLEQRLRPGTSQ